MNFAAIQAVLNDLPPTYKRPDLTYAQWIDALTSALYRGALAGDSLITQISSVANAQFGWADVWGRLFGVVRLANEPDQNYIARTMYIVTAGAGTPVGIANWILRVWGVVTTITDNPSGVGYTITFPSTATLTQINTIIGSLGRIRPAGVPFTIAQATGSGPYLDTINFFDAPRVTGAYLGGAASVIVVAQSAITNDSQPILPDLYLTDPILNPA